MEDKIVVKNTSIEINDYNFNDCKQIEGSFRIYDVITHSEYFVGLYYDEENRKLYLPRGIDIWYLENLFNCSAYIQRNMYNKYDTFSNIKISSLPRDEVQLKAIRFMVGSGEYTETITKSQLQVNLNTGKGKTYCSIATAVYMGIKSIIITDSITVLEQWRKSFIQYTNMSNRPQKDIYFIDGSKSIVHLLSKSEESLRDIKVFLISHATIHSYASTAGWEAIGDLFRHLRIGLKFYDESHKNFSNILMIDFFTTVYKTYYVTATPERSNSDENRIYQLCFKNILSIDLFDDTIDPHTKYIALRYNSRPNPQTVSNCKNKYGLDRNKYTDYIVTNENFQMMSVVVLDLALKLAKDENAKILIYVGTNNAIKEFKKYIILKFPHLANNIGIFTSIYTKEEKYDALNNKKIILSTTKSTGAAIDIKGLKVTIVLAEPFKSPVLARQTLGRTRDKDTYYIEVVDKGFLHCNSYFLYKRDIFAKYAESMDLIELSDTELYDRYTLIITDMQKIYRPSPYMINQVFPFHIDMVRPYIIGV